MKNIIYKIIKSIYKFTKMILLETAQLIDFLLQKLIHEKFINYINKIGQNNMHVSKKLVIFGNGPSLAGVLKEWKTNNIFKDADILVMNLFCHNNCFMEMQPKYYVIADPNFFDYRISTNKVDDMITALDENTSWKMFLYVPYRILKETNLKAKIINQNITLVPLYVVKYPGDALKLRNWFFKQGLGNGNYGTVILYGEYIGLTLGYKELYLYGADHNFFDGLCVNENNQLFSFYTHFYDDKPILEPNGHYFDGKYLPCSVYDFMRGKGRIFYGHDIMRKYADYCSAKIYNCTKNSMIDAYERYKTNIDG